MQPCLSWRLWGPKGPDGQPFNMPTHAVEAPNGNISSRTVRPDPDPPLLGEGRDLLTFGGGNSVFIPKRFNLGPVAGRSGTDPCQFNVPHELLVTADNLVYVMDRENHRWQVFATDGAFVSLQEHVSHPNRVALDADGTFHIASGASIEIWKRDGTKIGSWGEKGEAPGQFVAGSVHGAWMDTDGSLYTAEASRHNRLQKFVRV